jgi:hypothetical protein
VSVAPPYSPRHQGKAAAGEAEGPGHGLDCIVEILAQIVGLIASDAASGGHGGSMDEFGLELMNAALSAGGSGAGTLCAMGVVMPVSVQRLIYTATMLFCVAVSH